MLVAEQIRQLADRYDAVMGGSIYQGREDGARHYFADRVAYGDVAALTHMQELCVRMGISIEGKRS